jgi:dolichol kinase
MIILNKVNITYRKMNWLEIRRQLLHLLYGPLIIVLYQEGIINLNILLGVIIAGAVISFFVKRRKLSLIRRILSHFERDHHMEKFPGRGILFYTIGAYLVLLIFQREVAYAGILILAIGDAFSNVVGRHWGRLKTPLNPHKFLEGTFVGIMVSFPIAYYFVPDWVAAATAATVAMFLELPHIKISEFEIDDNLIIPLAASYTLSLFI